MCLGPPDVEPAKKYQASKEPVRRESSDGKKKGRKGTILTSSNAVGEVTAGGKKTALGT